MSGRSRWWWSSWLYGTLLIASACVGVGASTTAPSAPTGVSAVPGNAQATVKWTAPADKGQPITGYVITLYVGGSAQGTRTFNSTATVQTVTGLSNGTTYTFKVAAQKPNATGPSSNASEPITVGAPLSPTGIWAVLGDRQATVRWTAPADNGSPITGYVVTPYVSEIAQTPSTFGSTGTVQIVGGLTNGTTYTFEVAAINSNGTGPESAASNAVAPKPLPGTWQARSSASFARQEVSYVYAPFTRRFYLAGGRSTVQEAYDPRTDSWTTVAPLPAALDHIQGVVLNGRIYYVGGLVKWPAPATGSVYIYDLARDSVSTAASMPAGRERGAGGVAVYNGKIYYAGGLHNGVAVPWFDEYDPVANTWSTLPDMPESRDHFQAAVVGNRFYAIGGRNTSINATTTVNDAFDMPTRAWITGLAPLPIPRGGFGAAALGGEILIIGGEGAGHAYTAVEAYNTTSNTWTELAAMPTGRHGIEAAVCNGGAYVAGGGTRQGGAAPTRVQEAFFRNTVTTCGT